MASKRSENRFENLSRSKRITLLDFTVVCLFFLLETAAWGTFKLVSKFTGRAYIASEYVESFQLFGQKNIFEVDDEYRQFYLKGFKPNLVIEKGSGYATDKFGLPINGTLEEHPDLSVKGTKYRIFVLGGSTVMGHGSTSTLGAYLEGALNQSDIKRFEVITAGHDGTHSGHELARLSFELLHFHPDMIITFDGVNDVFWSTFLDPYVPNDHLEARMVKRILETDAAIYRPFLSLNWPSLDSFFRRFYIYQGIVSVFSKFGFAIPTVYDISDREYFREILDFDNAKFRQKGADTYLENLKSISAISNSRGIQTIHVLQPTLATELYEREELSTAEEWNLLEIKGLKGHLSRELRVSIYNDFYSYVRSEFASLADNPRHKLGTWVDLSRYFSDVNDLTGVYYDAVHYRKHRTQEIAKEVAVHVIDTFSKN